MQIKCPPCPPAIALIGKITRPAMEAVLQQLAAHGATDWQVSKLGTSADGDYFTVGYTRPNRPGRWVMVFGLDGSLWMD